MTAEEKPRIEKNPHGTMTKVCLDGLAQVTRLVTAAHLSDTIALLDWRQLRKYVDDLIVDAATEDGGLDEESLTWR